MFFNSIKWVQYFLYICDVRMKRFKKKKSQIKPPKITKLKGVSWISIHRDNIIEDNNMSLLNKYMQRLYYLESLEEYQSNNKTLQRMIELHNDCFNYQIKNEKDFSFDDRKVERLASLVESFYKFVRENWVQTAKTLGAVVSVKVQVDVETKVFRFAEMALADFPPNGADLDDAMSRMHGLIEDLIAYETKDANSVMKPWLLKKKKNIKIIDSKT